MKTMHCVNCRTVVTSRASTGDRGADIAWMVHCAACADLVEDQMELVEARPGGAPIDIYRCRSCGTPRSCRPGWKTRCMVCLDDRTHFPADLVESAARTAGHLTRTDSVVGWSGEEHALWRRCALDVIGDRLASLGRRGWTLLATDIQGLPWDAVILVNQPISGRSHGSWARHDACGAVQKITAARPECRHCPPEEGSRTHRAKSDQPHHLYLVHYRKFWKFGHGDANRVRAHLVAGAEPVCVLTAPFKKVVDAELAIKRAYGAHIIGSGRGGLPKSFGAGTEVLADRVDLDIRAYLSGPDVRDVTYRFPRVARRTTPKRRWWDPLRRPPVHP